ncbi:amidohydrolase [Brevibacillus humidisoli]|uniref:amidohydrolase n=1 Tax=Brevibacillus humidisoli TaxID=2895522 RepID=UPI001E36F7E0|nr:amidohydrolase [Brevibacillus humidisoli]UFJ39599.1 amidohydrolase [Brevibacillus humidisoli]
MMQKRIAQQIQQIKKQIIHWRRDFHQYPEAGWTEFRTASVIASVLGELGFSVKLGREVVSAESRMGVPDQESLAKARQRALEEGADPSLVEQMEDGLTGVVGIWDTGRPGPSIAFRFDIDALEIMEERSSEHLPSQQGFCSRYDGLMHACGHDGHAAIGLGLAHLIAGLPQELSGTVKLIFQPAEEGARGAKAMVDAGVVDDVDYLFAGHLGMTARTNSQVVCSVTQLFASTKMDVHLEGIPAHAAFAPHEGRNALMAAATMAVQLQGISRHGGGASRINVGMLQAGEGRNIIPSRASLKLETRGANNEVNQYMTDEAIRIIRSVAHMYGVKERIELVGQSISAPCDPELITLVQDAANAVEGVAEVLESMPFRASEDAAYLMEAVQKRGGMATYLLFGTELAAGHHHYAFDFNEETLPLAVEVYANLLVRLIGQSSHVSNNTLPVKDKS